MKGSLNELVKKRWLLGDTWGFIKIAKNWGQTSTIYFDSRARRFINF